MKYLIIAFTGILLGLTSCHKNDNEQVCYSFDIRQCQTDLFAQDVPESDSKQLRESRMKQWLEEQGVSTIRKITLDLGFHDVVCEACDICPQGDRYYIQLDEDSPAPDAAALRLLNFEEKNCSDIF